MKHWCRHVAWLPYPWGSYGVRWAFTDSFNERPVTRSWRMCPICGALRPTKKNIDSAIRADPTMITRHQMLTQGLKPGDKESELPA